MTVLLLAMAIVETTSLSAPATKIFAFHPPMRTALPETATGDHRPATAVPVNIIILPAARGGPLPLTSVPSCAPVARRPRNN